VVRGADGAGAVGPDPFRRRQLWKRKRGIQKELASRPRARIGEASGAALRVTGRVEAQGDLLTAPVSGRRCVAFQLRVEEWREQNRLARWHLLLDLQDARSFGLGDETGEAFVDAGAPFILALTFDEHGGDDPSNAIEAARMKALDGLIGPPPKRLRASPGRLRYREGVINEGDLVSVAGSGARELNPGGRSPNFRDPPMWLVLRGTDEEPLWVSDAPDFGPVGYD
jgi:hypothetical protein